jgi:hypothetical protein
LIIGRANNRFGISEACDRHMSSNICKLFERPIHPPVPGFYQVEIPLPKLPSPSTQVHLWKDVDINRLISPSPKNIAFHSGHLPPPGCPPTQTETYGKRPPSHRDNPVLPLQASDAQIVKILGNNLWNKLCHDLHKRKPKGLKTKRFTKKTALSCFKDWLGYLAPHYIQYSCCLPRLLDCGTTDSIYGCVLCPVVRWATDAVLPDWGAHPAHSIQYFLHIIIIIPSLSFYVYILGWDVFHFQLIATTSKRSYSGWVIY